MKKPPRNRAWSACVAIVAAAATAAGGCTVRLASGVSRSGGYAGASYVPRASAGSRDDVPVHGHHVRVGRPAGESVTGELIAAGEDEVVVESRVQWRVRIPMEDVKYVEIELAPGQAGPVALLSLGAMVVGLIGVVTLTDSSWISVFVAGWGVIWLPFGLLVGLPTAGVIAANGDGTLDSREVGLAAVRRNLYEFARFPQGEPGRAAKRAPPASAPRSPSVTPTPEVPPPSPPAPVPKAAAPRPSIETIPSVAPPPPAAPPSPAPSRPKPAPPSPAEPEDSDEPSVVPYSPGRSPPPPTR